MRGRLLAFPYDKDGDVPPEVRSAEGVRSSKPCFGSAAQSWLVDFGRMDRVSILPMDGHDGLALVVFHEPHFGPDYFPEKLGR
jgi:hypothetical protein